MSIEQQPENELGVETLSSENLIELAKFKGPEDPEVRQLLIQWMDETRVDEDKNEPSIEYLRVAVMHTIMKFRLGFLTEDEAIEELQEELDGAHQELDHGDLADTIIDVMLDIQGGKMQNVYVEEVQTPPTIV